MNGRVTRVLALGVVLLALIQCRVLATGIGPSVSYGLGNQDWADEHGTTDLSSIGLGFVLDTAVARDSLFNYRLEIGYERRQDTFDNDFTFDTDLLVLNNTFGFGIVRSHVVRVWLGPQLRIFGGTGSGGNTSGGNTDVTMLGAAAGLALGANFHLGDVVSLCISSSFLYSVASAESSFTYTYDGYGYHESYEETRNDTVSGPVADLRLGLLFRLGSDRM
ncbi:MAG: hypothetical protein WCL44_01190 [bacterium]